MESPRALNFEIVGVHPANKGAVLMMEAIRARLTESFPNARFAVPLAWPAEERLAKGLWSTPARTGRRPNQVTLLDHAPRKLQQSLGFIASRDIDVLLDASGFGYGDFWGLGKLRTRLTRRLEIWKKAGKKAILLPQALGPFTGPGMADAFRDAIALLDLAFVRDAASLAFVEDVVPRRTNIHRAPDFTNLLHPELPRRLEDVRGLSVLIPNEKMVTGKPDSVRATYLAFLKTAADIIAKSGRSAFILVHEGEKDRALARALNDSLDLPLRVVDEPSALVTKAIIAATELSVSSRFHGLVSGLSSAVPSLACGWSHKYLELMADYGCPDLVVDIERPDSWAGAVQRLIDSADSADFRQRLETRGEEERRKSEAMWTMVVEAITQP